MSDTSKPFATEELVEEKFVDVFGDLMLNREQSLFLHRLLAAARRDEARAREEAFLGGQVMSPYAEATAPSAGDSGRFPRPWQVVAPRLPGQVDWCLAEGGDYVGQAPNEAIATRIVTAVNAAASTRTPDAPSFKPGDAVEYRPSFGIDRWFAATVAGEPRKLGDSCVVRLRDLDPEYARIHHPGTGRTSVAAAECSNVRRRRPHLINDEFQSDKYPGTPRGKVPLSTTDPTAQDLLWEYAQRRRSVDVEFADDLETALHAKGYVPSEHPPLQPKKRTGFFLVNKLTGYVAAENETLQTAEEARQCIGDTMDDWAVEEREREPNEEEEVEDALAEVERWKRIAANHVGLRKQQREEIERLKKQAEENRRRYREENQHAQNDTTKAEALNDRHVREIVEARAEVERAKDELEKTHLESSALLDAATAAMVDAANIHVMLSEELDAAIQERDRALRFEVTEEQRDQAAEMLAKKAIGARDPRFVDVTTCRADVDRVLATLKATR